VYGGNLAAIRRALGSPSGVVVWLFVRGDGPRDECRDEWHADRFVEIIG
jgi:hypothetical protein